VSRPSGDEGDVLDVDVVRQVLTTRAGERVALSVITDGRGADAAAFTLPTDLEHAVAWVRRHASRATTVSIGIAAVSATGAQRLAQAHREGRRARPQAGEHDGYAWVAADLDPHDGDDLAVLHERLARYPHPPSLLTCSGRGLHAWWQLSEPVDVATGRQLCADLARALDGDRSTATVGQALRLAGTWNGKPSVQRRAEVMASRPQHYRAEDLTAAALALSPRPTPAPAPVPRRLLEHARAGVDVAEQLREHHDLAEELDRVAGPRQQGKWRCPDGHDGTASLGLHRDNPRRWVCFGGGHGDGFGRQAQGGQWSGDVVDLLALEAGQSPERFLATERARLAPAPAAPRREELSPPDEPPGWQQEDAPPAELIDESPREPEPEQAPRKAGREPSQADQLVGLAHARYDLVRSESNVFAVPRRGPRLALELRGAGGLRQHLAAAYYRANTRAASSGALADAMTTLEGEASEVDPQPVELRLARHQSPGGRPGVVLDLGTASGHVVVIDSHGWRVVERSPVIFRRTALTAPLPVPQPGGHLEELRELLNVTDETWPLLVGWLVAGLVPDIPHPIALLSGEQGTGKSTAGKYLTQVIDPAGVPLRSLPKDEEAWAVSAAASYVVGVDNVSRISAELSDAMCRAVTGDGVVRRRLYTDSDVSVLRLQRVLLLTSIDAGALRGDLAERLLQVDLERIDGKGRRTARDLDDLWRAAHPRVLGALLDLTVQVMAALPRAKATLVEHPRMADFAEVLLAVDLVRGTSGLDLYLRQGQQLARDVADSDVVAHGVLELMAGQTYGWQGTSTVLLGELRRFAPDPLPRSWPSDGARLAAQLRRLTPALLASGVRVEFERTKRSREVRLTHLDRALPEVDDRPLTLPGTTPGDTP